MPHIIDGYNLLNAAGIHSRGRGPGTLQKAREAMLNTLAESLPAEEVPRTTVVFDASESPWGVQREQRHKGLRVLFAAKEADADTLIEELIRADSAPRRLTVVSSDHRIQRAATRRKATAVDSDVWFRNLLRERAERRELKEADVAKPDGPFSSGDVDYWLREFGLEE